MNNNIFFLGCTQNYGYQFSAANTKVELMIRGLQKEKDQCIVHNGIIGFNAIEKNQKINNRICDIITYKQKGNQFISWIINTPTLYNDLKINYNKNKQNILIISFSDYHVFLLYTFLAKILHYKLVIISHEWVPTVSSVHPLRKPFGYLYAKTFGYFATAILPISEFIINRIHHFKKPYIKLPILSDFSENNNEYISNSNYFLYCVHAAYARVIYTIIDAFKIYTSQDRYKKLILILSGKSKEIEIIEQYIKKCNMNEYVIIKTNLSYKELINTYRQAEALLIPLDPNDAQDEARFSQKIAEYLSAQRPILTNNVGEIKYYFKDKENIIIASEYSPKGFADALKWINEHPVESTQIGENGYKIGASHFDYKIYGKILHDFFIKL